MLEQPLPMLMNTIKRVCDHDFDELGAMVYFK